ncbi:G-protein coupled receptor family C group 6 member A isoform X1 [Alosa pseudoharengus]|uniref:G-protein coupled receptor family C group 6 member A isoform X1 n=1 Tax=Alosa pseudoharengus TaxID=34774 RepID=UPI003F8CD409
MQMLLTLMLLLSWMTHTMATPPAASAPGDILLGAFFPIHAGAKVPITYQPDLSQPQPAVCVDLNTARVSEALVMIQAVEEANRSEALTKLGITLGYHIHDSCSDVTTALRASKDFTEGISWTESGASNSTGGCQASGNGSVCTQSVVAVVGASFSELSIALARVLTLELIPQISYSSTATILSDKLRFPAFLRTVPNDMYQTRAMAKLLSDNLWNWVGVITMDGDYGSSALDSFASEAAQKGICLAFKEILPESVNDPNVNSSIRQAVKSIRSNWKAKVIVSFAKAEYMRQVFEELQGGPAEDRVWIASDSWSTNGMELAHIDFSSIGKVVGFTFKSGNLAPFQQYLRELKRDVYMSEDTNMPFMREFYHTVDPDKATAILLNNTAPDSVFSIQMAISAITQAIVDRCAKRNDCKTPGAVKPWQLLGPLKRATFEMEGKKYSFDKNGDVNLGYDITIWRTSRGSLGTFDVVAEYHSVNNSITPTSREMRSQLRLFKDVVSKCSNSCEPGEMKKSVEGQHTCCYECINCTADHYSNDTDADQCLSCNASIEWAPVRSTSCTLKTLELLDWKDGFAIVLLTLAALGVVMALVIGVLFLWQRNTPVVRAAGGPLCQIILLSLTGSYVSVVFFVGHPSSIKCKIRQVLFGLSFTLCVSCILVKSLKILLAFNFNPSLQEMLRRLYKPYAIVVACMAVQVLVCTVWLVLRSPFPRHKPFDSTSMLAECDEGSYVAFSVMLAYIAVLALVCFGFAFKGRKLPESYNEAKFITFGMLIYLISWVIFIPVYVTTQGKYLPAVEMVVILLSNYGILCCHFLPKCYIILFKKEHNTKDAFLRNVYEYSQRSSGSLGDSTSLGTEEKTNSQPFTISRLSIYLPSASSDTVSTEATVSQSTQGQVPKPRLRRTFSI